MTYLNNFLIIPDILFFSYHSQMTKVHNEELRDLYSLSSIIRVIKSRRIRWAGHVARMGRRGTGIDYWWEGQRERDH
jgi:hypothetical protein